MTSRTDIDKHRIDIAIGAGSGMNMSKVKNKNVAVGKLRERLFTPKVDEHITLGAYLNLPKEERNALKAAAGNWTAAKYKSNRRKGTDLVGRSCVAHDIDHATPEQLDFILDGLAEVNRWELAMHTSRSHVPENQRWRLVIFCNRLMTPEEANAVYRLTTLYLCEEPEDGIEMIDPQGLKPNQTMFWPSVSKGQEFRTHHNPAVLLDVDEFLSEHPGWEDIESLPYREDEQHKGISDPNNRMEDPREKLAPIGPFCRAYTVEDVISEFIPEVYEPDGNSSGRYRFGGAGGASGAIVYDSGLFLHSHHANDPAEGLHNAFNLARIHLYGHLDDQVRSDTSPTSLPSYKAMVKWANSLPEVMAEQFAGHDDMLDDMDEDEDEGEAEAGDDARDLLGDELDDLDEGEESTKSEKTKDKKSKEWLTHLRRRKSGEIDNVLNNAALICMNDRRIAPCIGYNEFTHDPVCFKPIKAPKIPTPSPVVPKRDRKRGRRWEDRDDASIAMIASGNAERNGYEIDFPDHVIQKAVLVAGAENPINPVKDDIENCWKKWKAAGSPSGLLDTYTIKYLGVPDTPFHRLTGALFILGSVARTYEPGCKYDTMPVIEGLTGSGKSTFYQEIFLEEFVTELKSGLDDTGRLIEQTRAFRAVELAEMTAAKKVDSNTLKMQLSSARDVHRLAYGKREQEYDRQFLFVGTSNDDDYLTDPTSTRRFWVWKTPKNMFNMIDRDGLRAERHLIWGEAYQRYLDMRKAQPTGSLNLDIQDPDIMRERDAIAEKSRRRTAAEEIATVIEEWLDKPERACDVMLDADGMTLKKYESDETLMLRNMVTAKDAYLALRLEEVLAPYRNADVRTYGKALALVRGWRNIGKVRRHGLGVPTVWFVRGEDGPLWVPFEGSDDEDDEGDEDDLLA
ncbi:VapE domain-containing protein [Tropicimonas sp. IMCC6043]|uniref:VapE domain-containing protein n=1 Tax=Tropicimonas sp. IMCC6043 TaxID=2510645 RepID=UPI00101D268B|nr:VapE domain-containing protein [Tropicimonas sp. IMCC6043]RYH06037.1 hypothetical protein EU800_25170 [Tropicimonas sp. IMCC6043]